MFSRYSSSLLARIQGHATASRLSVSSGATGCECMPTSRIFNSLSRRGLSTDAQTPVTPATKPTALDMSVIPKATPNSGFEKHPFRSSGKITEVTEKAPEDHHIVHVTATRNNTMATLTDASGNALVWASAGTCGLKKSARGTSDAGYQTILQLAEKAEKKNVQLRGVEVRLKLFGPGREMAFRAVRALGWNIKRITDVTPIRHGGCRPPRKRRL